MAVIKKNAVSLKALTATALSLPGMMVQPALAAEGDEVDFQYSHYQEGKRDITYSYGETRLNGKSFNPIEVDSLHGSAKVSLTDRVKFAFNYIQDTWGGATPVATAPSSFYGNVAPSLDTLSNASPYLNGQLFFDSNMHPLNAASSGNIDPNTGLDIFNFSKDTKLTHIMATASPETRKQGDFKLSYEFEEAAISAGGGISIEDDYESRFGNLGARLDFNQKQTTLNADLSYTNSDTRATLDHSTFVSTDNVPDNQIEKLKNRGDAKLLNGNRQDWSTHLGLTQVLNKNALLGADFSYTRGTGYLSNPYKGVAIAFIDPDQPDNRPPGGYVGNVFTLTDQRPEVRNQYGVGGRYVQFIEPLNAALHFSYQFSADDWGIQSHSFDADWVQPVGAGWTLTPRIRYYSQDAANFYAPYLTTQQAFNKPVFDANQNQIYTGPDGKDYAMVPDPNSPFGLSPVDAQGNPAPSNVTFENSTPKFIRYDTNKLPAYFSSDHRLSGFGTLSGGITIAKQFAKGLTLETGFEYYTHQGSLKIGGNGEGAYADFDYWLANAALKVNLDALTISHGSGGISHGHQGHHEHAAHEPAGVMFGHMLPNAGDFMVGYRYMWNSQGGGMLNRDSSVTDSAIVANGCNGPNSLGCFLTPTSMSMSMHMLDLMYAPTDWLTLMLMPQFVDMSMDMRKLDGGPASTGDGNIDQHITHHIQNGHESGGIGDLGMYALFKVLDNGTHHVHATAGLSAPTGDVNLQFRRNHGVDGGFMDYGMQLGSGTWDFRPSVTYTGRFDDFSWGVQANGIVRIEDHNKSGYRLGDMFQGTVWGGYNLTNWLTASVRGVYTVQGSIEGQFAGSAGGQFTDHTTTDEFGNVTPITSSILKFGPQDYPDNYGGRFWDVGFGLSAMVPVDGLLGGNRLSVEWLQPVHTDYNGYQLERDGALSATWSVMF